VCRSQRELTHVPNGPTLRSVGEVRIVEEEMNPYIISRRVPAGWVRAQRSSTMTTMFTCL
jgi:hypothetical protein